MPAVADSGLIPVSDPENLSFYFTGLLKKTRTDSPQKTLIAHQSEVAVHTLEENIWRRVFYGAIDKRLLESLHFFDGRELEIVSRGRSWGYRWQAIYGKETLYLPKNRIGQAELYPDRTSGFVSLSIDTAGSRHSFLFRVDNPELENYRHFMKKSLSRGIRAV
jgi:hypothetical protein